MIKVVHMGVTMLRIVKGKDKGKVKVIVVKIRTREIVETGGRMILYPCQFVLEISLLSRTV